MKNRTLFALWGGLFAVCAGLGFIPEPVGALKWLSVAISVLFFVPPLLLVRQAAARRDRTTLALIRNLSVFSLVLTLVLLVLNFLTLMASEALGNILYYMLVIVSSPMVCSRYWVLSLFLWACLMILSATELKKK